MTALAARARTLRSEIQQLDLLQRAAHDLKDYQSRRDRLQAVLAKLAPPATFLALFVARGIAVVPAVNPPEGPALALAVALADRFATDPSVVLSAEFVALLKALTSAQEQVAMRARASWSNFAAPQADAVSKELLDALERIDTFRGTVQRIRARQVLIGQLLAKEWVTEDELDRFHSLLEERTRAWDALEAGGGIPDGIVEFLKQCNKGGVRLDAVTGEAIEWLRARGILGCFRVVL